MITLGWRSYDIEIRDEPTYSPGSADNSRSYEQEVVLGSAGGYVSSRHGVTVVSSDGPIASCVVLATGGPTTVHERSVVVQGHGLYLVVGNQICAFQLPSLILNWSHEVDVVTCYGVVA